MDEYQLEISSLRVTLSRLRAEQADPEVIEEYEAELRILQAIYAAAVQTLAAGEVDLMLPRVLDELGFGDWSLPNVYSFVYDAVLEMDEAGHDLAARVSQTDFAGALRAAQE